MCPKENEKKMWNNSSCFSLFAILTVVVAYASTLHAQNAVPQALVVFKRIEFKKGAPKQVDLSVRIGDFVLLRQQGLHGPLAGINRSVRVRSRFRLPLDIEVEKTAGSAITLPGYVADWDDSKPARVKYCHARMEWGFSGRLHCGKLVIVVRSQLQQTKQKQPKR